jgi:endonuclease/exonuclease/phosphatase family metal-dependent hydrolase
MDFKNVPPLLLLFLFLPICGLVAQQKPLTLMTYNIYHGENPYTKSSNLASLADFISLNQLDLVALQEVDSMTLRSKAIGQGIKLDLMQELQQLTGMHGGFAKAIVYGEGGYGEGILSKWPMDFTNIKLPSPAGGEARALALATVVLENGQKLVFAGTHLCHEFEANRIAQVEAILQVVKSIPHPVVLTGDFNFTTEEATYELLARYFMDAAAAAGNPEATYPADAPEIRIDYFWLDKAHRWTVHSAHVPELTYSDHRPVLIQVSFSTH